MRVRTPPWAAARISVRMASAVIGGAFGAMDAVEQDGGDVEGEDIEAEAEGFDEALGGDAFGVPAAVLAEELDVGAGVDDDAGDAELGGEAEAVLGGIDELFAEQHGGA